MFKRAGWAGSVWLLCCACAVADAIGASDAQTMQQRLKAHIEFLAADELGGRGTGTQGYDIAANYVASAFRQMGLEPGGGNGSYFQSVPLRSAWPVKGSLSMRLTRDDGVRDFKFIEDFFLSPSVSDINIAIEAPMVFAGYGIHAPALGYSDFTHLDVAGKVVVSLAGQPVEFPSEEGAHFASGQEKARVIAAMGAVGSITIHTPRTERIYKWSRVRSRVGKSSMTWLKPDGTPSSVFPPLKFAATISHVAAAELFESAAFSMQQLLDDDVSARGLPVFSLPGSIKVTQKSRHENLQSPNVVAVLPGTDPLLANEYVVYMGHLDHLGTTKRKGGGDGIHNGALDNASGISVLIETARQLVEQGGLRRSVVFLAVTAEEKGLIGSEYFAQNPTIPADSMVATINLDMPILLYEFGDVVAFGAEHSSMIDAVSKAATEYGVVLSPDPFPQLNIFIRSDHYRFVQQGIPSIYLVTGSSTLEPGGDAQAIFDNYLQEHYHQPDDDLNLPINYVAAERFTHINTRIGEIVGNASQRPRWNEGDFFGETFGRQKAGN